MNDLKNARNNRDELDRHVVDALAGLMNTAPIAADHPTDEALLDSRQSNGSGRSRILLAVAASAVVALGAGGLIFLQPQSDTGVSDSLPNPELSTPTAADDSSSTMPAPTEASSSILPAPTEASSSILPAPTEADDELAGLYLPTVLPDGYQLVGAAAVPASNAPVDTSDVDTASASSNTAATTLTALPSNGEPGGFVSASVIPNINNDTIDTFDTFRGWGELSDYERQTAGGTERLVQIQPADDLGPFTVVTWPASDVIITVTGRAEPTDVITFAESMTPASTDQFRAAGEQITGTAQALNIFDQSTFDDGTSVSIRSIDATGGPIAMCVDAPITRCTYLLNENSLGGSYQNSLTAAFDVNGETRLVAWHDTAEAQRLGEATLEASMMAPGDIAVDQAAPGDGQETTASITQTVTTDLGQFIEVAVPFGEAPPAVTYQLDDGGLNAFTVQAPSPLSF